MILANDEHARTMPMVHRQGKEGPDLLWFISPAETDVRFVIIKESREGLTEDRRALLSQAVSILDAVERCVTF